MAKHKKKAAKHSEKAAKKDMTAKEKVVSETKADAAKPAMAGTVLTGQEKTLAKNNVLKVLWGASILLSLIIIIMAISGKDDMTKNPGSDNGFPDSNGPAITEKVKVDFYVMSQCPYGTDVEDAIAPVIDQLGPNLDFNLDFISTDLGDGTFRSLHGQPETDGNIVQLCAIKYNSKDYRYMDMITCMNQNAAQIPGNWERCASDNGLAVAKIKACYEGEEGKELLRQSLTRAQDADAQGSPTIYIGDEAYSGGRTTNDFLRAICLSFAGEKPEACSSIPEPVKVNLLVINDKRCAECNMAPLVSQLKSIFPGLVVSEYDYSDADGKQLYEDFNLKALPAAVFDETVQEDDNYAAVAPYLEAADADGKYANLKIGAQFDPTKEICDNGIDDTADGKVDCADPDCTESMSCRTEIKADLQVFIMSDCPYGRKAIEAAKELKDNFGDDMSFGVHYIASENPDGSFNSLHGQYEADENMIQLCVEKNSPDAWFSYMYCRATKGVKGIDWKGCAQETDVDVDAVQACFDSGEGASLLSEDIKMADNLGVTGSPTWLANNRYTFGGIYAEPVKTEFCKNNAGLAGCSVTLSGNTGAPTGSC